MNSGCFKKGHIPWIKGKKVPQFTGKNHYLWKGDQVGKGALHCWIKHILGTPMLCSECGTTKGSSSNFHWANISGKYKRDVKDFKRLCAKCHKAFDYQSIPKGEKHWRAKLTEKKVIKIKFFLSRNISQRKLAKKYGVCQATIKEINKKEIWKHIK